MLKQWFKTGSPWIWLNAGAAAICLVMVLGLILLIAARGLGHFWPAPILETTYQDPERGEIRLLGTVHRSETVTAAVLQEAGMPAPEGVDIVTRHLLKLGNRDFTNRDFVWYVADYMDEWRYPDDAIVLERTEWGDFLGYFRNVKENGRVVAQGDDAWDELFERVRRVVRLRREVQSIERDAIGGNSFRQEQLRLRRRGLELRGVDDPEPYEAINAQLESLQREYEELDARRNELRQRMARDSITAEMMDGRIVTIPVENIVRATRPNVMSLGDKLAHYASTFRDFITGYPREANTEGGIFPAIFGTVAMVLVMSILVTPVGVLAAIYLREYARQGPLTRLIRICVNNLAGVPSIVFGVFGLGFFIYFLGGSIDRIFYPEALPAPTFGRGGLFWASLTLALLTLPVVIVATEEGLTRIPKNIRDGSLALGATKAETIWKVIVPMAAPAMMTGLILAVARAAGEVAPLMLVGVVKLAPSLPIDSHPPYLHLDRSFMHLGFHIFDVGFQSPNVEAGRPLVYATSLVLIFIIIVLNLAAIAIRHHLREKFKSGTD